MNRNSPKSPPTITYTTQHTVAVFALPKTAPKRSATATCKWERRRRKAAVTPGAVRVNSGKRRAAPKAQTRRRKANWREER